MLNRELPLLILLIFKLSSFRVAYSYLSHLLDLRRLVIVPAYARKTPPNSGPCQTS